MGLIGASNAADPLSLIYLVVATLVSAGIIYAAFRNSIKHMIERIVDDRIVVPISGIHDRIDSHMVEEERKNHARDVVVNQTATDVAYLRGKLEPR